MRKFHNIAQRWHRPALALFLLTGSAYAGEYAVLANGFRLHADHHETAAERVRLFDGAGVSEIAAADVVAWETEEYVAPPAPPAEVPVLIAKAQERKGDIYAETAKRHGLPEALVRSIVRAESNGNARAVSPKGAVGLMQLMPATARELGADPTVPEQNVDAGTRYLKQLLAKYEDHEDQVARAVAAYNAGPGAVDRYRGVPPYRETQVYVRRVLNNYIKASKPPTTTP